MVHVCILHEGYKQIHTHIYVIYSCMHVGTNKKNHSSTVKDTYKAHQRKLHPFHGPPTDQSMRQGASFLLLLVLLVLLGLTFFVLLLPFPVLLVAGAGPEGGKKKLVERWPRHSKLKCRNSPMHPIIPGVPNKTNKTTPNQIKPTNKPKQNKIKPTNQQTNRPTNQQTNKPTHNQNQTKPTNQQTSKPAHQKSTNQQTNATQPTNKQTNKQANNQTNKHTKKPRNKQTM